MQVTHGPLQPTAIASGTPEGTIIIDGVDIAAEFFFGILISNSSATQTISK